MRTGTILLAAGLCTIAVLNAQAETGISSATIWYDKPAAHFTQSLPLGNGRLGAMVFGGVHEERIVLNEISMWSGSHEDADREKAHQALPEIQRLLRAGKNIEAQQLVHANFLCKGRGSGHASGVNLPFGCYQTLGDLRIRFGRNPSVRSYRRWLKLDEAVALLHYETDKGVSFEREAFTSAPDHVFITSFSCDGSTEGLSLETTLTRPERAKTVAVDSSTLLMSGQLNNGTDGKGMKFACHLRAMAKDGKVSTEGDKLIVEGAKNVILLVTARTDYVWPTGERGADPIAASMADMTRASAKPLADLRAAHVADHRKYFDRVSLTLDDGKAETAAAAQLPTDQRLRKFWPDGSDPALAALYFQYGRYLLISSSRPGTMPANLQGLWAEEIQTPWNGDYHLDCNVQMNYWPAEVANLADCHVPMLELIESLQQPGRKTARAYYDADGWVAHVITNVWGFTAPGEHASWGSTASGSGWLCQHLWQHYEFNPDRKYLEWAYPILKGSAEFYLDLLIEEPKHGWLVTAPSNSPENTYILPDGQRGQTCMGPAVDMQIVRELFANCIRAAEILDTDEAFRGELQQKLKRLAPNQIGKHGQLMEWLEDYDEAEVHHRHVSHLYALYPGDGITLEGTPKLAEATRATLDRRGFEGDVGWSNAWKTCFWARLGDGQQAHSYLRRLIGINSHANLFDAIFPRGVFQIDGNLAGTAGIAEMLLQSHGGVIRLLPALPDAWPHGKVTGLRARGGFELDMQWEDSKLVSVTIKSKSGTDCTIRYGSKSLAIKTQPGKAHTLHGNRFRQ